ncbi:MAG: discoidin domain-containing protein [Verrucomicrobia bacterium]|nr:discoidin domain-containing protein [Verrucomicrobiota bacterium]
MKTWLNPLGSFLPLCGKRQACVAGRGKRWWGVAPVGLALAGGGLASSSSAASVDARAWAEQLEADWRLAEKVAAQGAVTEAVTTRSDAAGGCDGVKTGEWGFHTGEAENPWWQVDLGRVQAIERVMIWNRQSAAAKAARVQVQLSDGDGSFRTVYRHAGGVFGGTYDQKPLVVGVGGERGRIVRVMVPGKNRLHLDEIEVFGPDDPARNLALRQPADQCSISNWSVAHVPVREVDWRARAEATLAVCRRLNGEGWSPTGEVGATAAALAKLERQLAALPAGATAEALFVEARRWQRRIALRNPLLREIDTLLFTKRVPGSFNHMSDQHYGWWSKPGGGIYLLRGLAADAPREECITATAVPEPGSFMRPTLSYDGRKVLFAWCRHYPHLAAEKDKLDKAKVPEDAFYHLFEMAVDGTGLRQLTRGKYDDFDGRYLPDGRIVFLSTRRGQAVQVGRASAARTMAQPDCPDSYVRCGGGPERPVAVYTLHTMKADGSDMMAISPFEMFEWTPEVGRDGSILYSRWDYIDRDNMPYMGLWSIRPDGTDARLVYKNYTKSPHCTFEAKPVPGSHKIIFTGSAHHAQTMGSLALFDPSAGQEGGDPITRLTPEVVFPEIEGWPTTSYANPWPLSERFHLVAWGAEGYLVQGRPGWSRWHEVQRPRNGMALYLYDAATRTRELLWSDRDISCGDPLPVRARERPPILASQLVADAGSTGSFLVSDVYQGLPENLRGTIRALRVVAVPAKTHPTMNFPSIGLTRDDPGKCVLGTVPVEADGSAHFRVPAGVIVFFQALDADGVAVQTMRGATHVQPGQTLSCIGCHERREDAPPVRVAQASRREPSVVAAGPEGSWPLRFDQLVQPVLDRQCVSCHHPQATDALAAKFNLTPAAAYAALVGYGKPSLRDQVMEAYRRGYSVPGDGIAQRSALWALLVGSKKHYDVTLDAEARERLLTWLDTYAQRQGHFSDQQEEELRQLRRAATAWLAERPAPRNQSLSVR